MSPLVLQRQAALVAAALLAGLMVVAFDRSGVAPEAVAGPPPARWESAVAGVLGPDRTGETTTCGVTIGARTLGVEHPVLPCGVALVLSYRGREVRAKVIETGPVGAGAGLAVTPALGRALGLEGAHGVRWRFAG